MAGKGKRMRPHTLTVPKPLLKIAGKSIVERLVEDISNVSKTLVTEIAFIISSDFGKEVEDNLLHIAENVGSKGKIYYQNEALGTAHAVLCAKESLCGDVVVAFADTLFKTDFVLDKEKDSIIWVHKVKTPENFGVVKIGNSGYISDFIEKPQEFVSDLAIIGIYYFKDGENLKNELNYLVENNISKGGEYQLTDALINMNQKGVRFSVGQVDEWLDCGNKNATVYTNQRILEHNNCDNYIDKTAVIENSVIIKPCYLGPNAKVIGSIIGPHVSIENNTIIENSIITNSIIQLHTRLSGINIDNSMIGSYVDYKLKYNEVSIGDFTTLA